MEFQASGSRPNCTLYDRKIFGRQPYNPLLTFWPSLRISVLLAADRDLHSIIIRDESDSYPLDS